MSAVKKKGDTYREREREREREGGEGGSEREVFEGKMTYVMIIQNVHVSRWEGKKAPNIKNSEARWPLL